MPAVGAPPEILVVVIAYKSARHMARLSACLAAQTLRDFRVIVWDNASPPDERPAPEDLPADCQFVQSPENLGFAAGNNRAAALEPDAKFIALLNPDAFPAPDWLERLRAAADRWPQAGAFGSTQHADEAIDRLDGLGDAYHAAGIPWRGGYGAPIGDTLPEAETFSACAAAALYRREAWAAAGGFDERFFCYCEDVDLGFRLRLLGWPTIQVPDAIVRHVGGGSSGARSDFAVFHGTRNRLWTFVKCMPGALFWALLPAHMAATALFLAVSPFRGSGKATWRGVAAGVRGLPQTWRARHAVQSARRAKLREIARALAWSPMAVLRRAPVLRQPAMAARTSASRSPPE